MSGLSYFDNGGQTATDNQPVAYGKPVTSRNVPTPTGNIPISEGVLSAMEDLYADRLARQSGFMEAMKDAAAWWSGGVEGPSAALSRRTQERQKEEENLFNLQTQIAQQRAAQEQAKKSDAALKSLFGPQPSEGVTSAGGNIVGPGGTIIPPNVAAYIKRIAATQGPVAAEVALNKWEAERLQEQSKGRYNPTTFKPEIEVRIKGTDKTEFVDADIRGRLSDYGITEPTREQLQAVKEGRPPISGVPARTPAPTAPAPTAPAPTAPAPTTPAAKPVNYTFDELSEDQKNILKAKLGEEGLIRDVFSRPDSAELFNKIPLDKRKKLFDIVGPSESVQPTQVAAAPSATATDVVAPTTGPIAQAPAPVAPKPAEDVYLPDIQAKRKIETETETARIGEIKKADVKKIENLERADDEAGDTLVKMKRMQEIVASAPEFFGLSDKPGATGAAIGIAMTGVKIGQNGQLAMPGVEDFVRKVSPDLRRRYPNEEDYKKKLAEVKEVASYLHEVELVASRAYKGQGQVSDYERKILAAIAGSTSDPARLLLMKAKWFELKAQNDREKGDLLRTMRQEKGPFVAMYEVEQDPRFAQLRQTQRTRMNGFFSPEVVTKAASIDLNKLPQEGPQTSTAPSRQTPPSKFKPDRGLLERYSR